MLILTMRYINENNFVYVCVYVNICIESLKKCNPLRLYNVEKCFPRAIT